MVAVAKQELTAGGLMVTYAPAAGFMAAVPPDHVVAVATASMTPNSVRSEPNPDQNA
jgi:hypothetical protein